MKKLDKEQTFRTCQYYKDTEDKQDIQNLQDAFSVSIVKNQAPRYTDKVGREHIEVPAIILGQQVIHGAGGYEFGAELVCENALYMSINQWNDKPVVIYHTDGSARDIENLENRKVGFVYNAEIIGNDTENNEKSNIRIKCMLRLDVELLREHEDGQTIIDMFDSGRIMEMSTGYYVTNWLWQEGSFRGRDFAAEQVEIMPDHLALLPNAVGAYSVSDGGGANRINEGETMLKENERNEVVEIVDNAMEEKLKEVPTKNELSELKVGIETSLNELKELINPIVKEKEEAEISMNEALDALVTKVAEKTGLNKNELAGTPEVVLNHMLQDAEIPEIPHPDLEVINEGVLIPSTHKPKEESE